MATKKRLIDANRLLRDPYFQEDRYPESHLLRMAIGEQPTIDAVEVVHGQVIVCDGFESDYHEECSVCGSWEVSVGNNYCPNCGAKMDGGTA